MKRHLYFIAVAILAVMATSCVEMPEEKGIDEIYAARVDFMKAQTVLKAAEMKMTEANTAIAVARTKNMEALVQAQELQNKIKEATTAQDKAKFEELLKQLKANNDKDLIDAQISLTYAQSNYQQALASIELAKKDIPVQYQNKLFNLKYRLTYLSYYMGQNQAAVTRLNLQLNAATGGDSADISNRLSYYVNENKQGLDLKNKVLASLREIKSSAGTTSLTAQRDAVKAKIDAFTTELASNQIKASTLNTLYQMARNTRDSLDYLRYGKSDNKATVSIPDGIKSEFEAYYNGLDKTVNFLSSDKKTYSCVGSLNNLVLNLQNALSFAQSKPASDDWDALISSIKTELDKYKKTQSNLEFAYRNAVQNANTKWNEWATKSNYGETLSFAIGLHQQIYDVLNLRIINNESGANLVNIDDLIANAEQEATNAQSSLNEANARLDSFKKTGYSDWYGNFMKDFRDEIAFFTKAIADQQVEFDMLTKQMNALIALINSQTK